MLVKLSAFSWMMSAVFAPPSRSSAVNASVVVTSIAEPSSRTCSEARSPLAGWAVWPATWKCAPALLKSPGAPPDGATEFGSHLPTEWMWRPWKPGASRPVATVLTVRVAKSPVNAISAVATVVPSGLLRSAVSVSLAVAGCELSPLAPAFAEGLGEPVQTDGVVPGCVATGSYGLHALAIGTMSAAAARRRIGAEIGMPESLAGDHHDDSRWLLCEFGAPWLDGRFQKLAHLVCGFPLARLLAEVHRRARDVLEHQVAGLGHVPLRVAQPAGHAFGRSCHFGDVVHAHVGLG